MEFQTDICEICGSHLISIDSKSDSKLISCNFCKLDFDALIYCPNGHYICDSCHSKEASHIILEYCSTTTEVNPYKIATHLLKHPSLKMYGPEHHILVPLVILAMVKNLGLTKLNNEKVQVQDFKTALKRASQIPGGWCGFFGSCGAGIGAGVAISVLTNANPSKAIERTYANKTVSNSLARIADNLEHCCKRSLKHAISEGIITISEILNENINFKPNICNFRILNDRCEQNKCPFF